MYTISLLGFLCQHTSANTDIVCSCLKCMQPTRVTLRTSRSASQRQQQPVERQLPGRKRSCHSERHCSDLHRPHPSGTYTLLFVNSSNYELDHPQVYYTSSSFEIKPNGTQPAPVTANTNADPSSSSTTAATGSATATLATASATGTNRASNGALGMTKGSTATVVGSVGSVVFGLGLGLLA